MNEHSEQPSSNYPLNNIDHLKTFYSIKSKTFESNLTLKKMPRQGVGHLKKQNQLLRIAE